MCIEQKTSKGPETVKGEKFDFVVAVMEKAADGSYYVPEEARLMKDIEIGKRILAKLENVKYGAYNQELGRFLYEAEFDDYIDVDNMNEFLVRTPRQLMIYKGGTCYDTANYIHMQLYICPEIDDIEDIQMIFYEYPIEGGETQTHLTIVYQMKGSDKWIHVEYSDVSRRGVHVLNSINDVFSKEPSFINWNAPIVTKPTPMFDYYMMCKQLPPQKTGEQKS